MVSRTMDIENNEKDKSGGASASWGARHKLIIKAFFMCALCYSLRFNLSIAIVAMVDESHSTSSENSSEESLSPLVNICPALMEHTSNDSIFIYLNTSEPESRSRHLYGITEVNSTVNKKVGATSKTFRWNEKDQGLILGSFFWGYMASQFPAGLLAYKYGGKWVAGLGMIWLALFSIALPQAAIVGGRDFIILVRVLQGFSSGFVIPSLVVILSRWTPPQERARLSAMCMSGLPLGTSMTMIVSGYLIPTFGWPSVFYTPGVITIIWFIVWSATAYSTPDEDPSISPEELMYLKSSLAGNNNNNISSSGVELDTETANESHSPESTKLSEVPWREIATSVPIWAIFTSQFCSAWGHNMQKSEGPKYLHSALHFDIHQNSYLSASPYICQFVVMLIVGRLSDYLIEKKVVSMLSARKICNTIGQWGCALFFVGIILAGCNRAAAVFCYIVSGMIGGAMTSGCYVNIIDVSPRYAGTIEGIINTAANIAGFGAPYVAGLILFHEPSILGWNYVFLVPVITNIIGNSVFLFGASTQVQSWNYNPKNCDKDSQQTKNNNE